ncbi:nucleotide sugar dehydrogenase [Actinoplanes teichomyceticus]|uniref:Nucleotide sugar dehydrogenase n=1 Tax=Actinoplanes teichomyceticus TaxID=1867 RepID=A0A561VSS7_ACTTI|nr:nucleotide sugar dehydrogenase [Actinoplanes teichomyceticus]TWG14674.1 nucleotide sugar dehydrogenase [Actinoplanes teichomyceticus]GIF10077.1 UDP-N-acetyl-D-glucosamine dehydrogenase [Actinoplanes teichomyceticus]
MSYDLAVVGLGYVGMPLAREATVRGLKVLGLDSDRRRVASLNDGRSHVDDLSDGELEEMLAEGFRAGSDPAELAGCETIVVCVPTPLGEAYQPDLTAVVQATTDVARHLRPGTLVVLESTTWPGTTETVIRPLLETSGLRAGVDFHLAYSPERIDPGNEVYGLGNTPKVVGGLTPACRDRATAFYGKFIPQVAATRGLREAEMAKLIENTYRAVNIALVNEMATFCEELGVDIWDAIAAAATKPFGFQKFLPGPGVGGHCIPVDPAYLVHAARRLGHPFRMAELAQEINDAMPAWVLSRVQRALNGVGKPVSGARILLLGVTYKPDIADARGTPALPLARSLHRLGAEVRFGDPFVRQWSVDQRLLAGEQCLQAAVRDADLVVLLQDHRAFDLDMIAREARLVLDTRGVIERQDNVIRL